MVQKKSKDLKLFAESVRLRNTFNNFVINNIEESKGIERIEKFVTKYFFLFSSTFEDYSNSNRPRHRIIKSILMKSTLLLTALRFGVSAIFNRPWIMSIMSDSNYLLGNGRLFSTMLSGASFSMYFISLVILIREYNYLLDVIVFLNDIKRHRNKYSLSAKYMQRFGIYSKLMTKYILNQIFYSLSILTSMVMICPTIIAYLDSNMDFSLICIILWDIITIIFNINFFSITAGGFGIWFLTSLYLKYQYFEINEQIEESLKYRNVGLLIDAITKHDFVSQQTVRLNHLFKYILFILHYVSTPSANILMYLTHSEESNMWVRFWAIFAFILIAGIIFSINLFCALFSKPAHSSLRLLYSFMVRNNVSTRDRFKLMNFIEKLSGPDIGFYCLNLFAMNNYQFFQYVMHCTSYYILFLIVLNEYK